MKNSVQSETRKRREGTSQINSGWKLVGLHGKYQLSNSISHHSKMCFQQFGINSRG